MKITGSIQVKSGRYYVVYQIDGGKQKWKATKISVGKPNRKGVDPNRLKAEEFKALFFRTLSESIEQESQIKKVFVVDYLQDWLKREEAFVKFSTFEGYQKMMNGKIIPYFKRFNFFVDTLKTTDIEDFLIYMKDHGRQKSLGGLKRKSVMNLFSVLKLAFDKAVELEYCKKNPCHNVKFPKFDEIVEDEGYSTYSKEQVTTLLTAADDEESYLKLFIYLDCLTGARKGEILGMAWNDVDFEKSCITIKRNRIATTKDNLSLVTTPKTKSSNRCIFLPKQMMDMLFEEKRRQVENRELLKSGFFEFDTDFVIRKTDGSLPYPSSITRAVKRVMENAGLPIIRVHDLRHTVASLMFEFADIKKISTQLGHSDTRITEKIYIHRKNITDIATTEKLASIIGL